MTEYVVNRLTDEFGKQEIAVDCFKIEDTDSSCDIAFSEYDLFGLAYPVHSFNAPEIVIKFANKLPVTDGKDTFIFYTAGEDSYLNYASSNLLIKKLNKKNYQVFYDKLVVMPCNFIIKFDEEKVREIIAKIKEDIPSIAQEIISHTSFFMRKNPVAQILSVVGRLEWLGARTMGIFLFTKDSCTGCGKCIKECPNQNIIMKKKAGTLKKAVAFKWHCGLCMRCIYGCPENAIQIRHPFRFIRIDKWYDPLN